MLQRSRIAADYRLGVSDPPLRIATTLSRHEPTADAAATTGLGIHLDWYLHHPEPLAPRGGAPASPEHRLTTFRVPLAWSTFPAPPHQDLPVVLLPPHRMRYLSFSGLLSDGRGKVSVSHQGMAEVLRWSSTKVQVRVDGHLLTVEQGRLLGKRERELNCNRDQMA